MRIQPPLKDSKGRRLIRVSVTMFVTEDMLEELRRARRKVRGADEASLSWIATDAIAHQTGCQHVYSDEVGERKRRQARATQTRGRLRLVG